LFDLKVDQRLDPSIFLSFQPGICKAREDIQKSIWYKQCPHSGSVEVIISATYLGTTELSEGDRPTLSLPLGSSHNKMFCKLNGKPLSNTRVVLKEYEQLIDSGKDL
jgi:hypothetical protein